jgi:uncharacterized protein YbbC (DUF1343 family)
VPIRFTPRERQYAGRDCGGVQILITDRDAFEPLTLGIGLAVVLHEDYPKDWEPSGFLKMIADRATYDALLEGRGVAEIVASWGRELEAFRKDQTRYLIYE